MKFIDFSCTELIGKSVLLCTLYRSNPRKSFFIRKIVSANRHHFNIELSALQFDYSGRQLLKTDTVDQMQMSACILITEDEALQLKSKWSEQKKVLINSEIVKHTDEITKLKSKLENHAVSKA